MWFIFLLQSVCARVADLCDLRLVNRGTLFMNRSCVLQVDEAGRYTGEYTTVALSGAVRQRGESDACMNRLMFEKKILSFPK